MTYYKGFSHVNTTDVEETVVTVTSTSEEKKRIVAVEITKETEEGEMRPYVDREAFYEGGTFHPTAQATISNKLVIPINKDLAEGEKFKLTLKNASAGTNAELYGHVVYEIA